MGKLYGLKKFSIENKENEYLAMCSKTETPSCQHDRIEIEGRTSGIATIRSARAGAPRTESSTGTGVSRYELSPLEWDRIDFTYGGIGPLKRT